LGARVSLLGHALLGASFAVLDCFEMASTLALRSVMRLGSAFAVLRSLRLGSSLSVLDFGFFGSSVSLRSFSRLGRALSYGGVLNFYGDLEVMAPAGIYGPETSDDSRTRRLSFPESDFGGLFHGLWYADYALSTSDRRLKHNVAPLRTYLQKRQLTAQGDKVAMRKTLTESAVPWVLRELRPVSFRFKMPDTKAVSPERYGFVAQEVERVLPELVRGAEGRTKHLLYQDLLAVLTLSLQEQASELQRQDDEVLESQRQVQRMLDHAGQLERVLDRFEASRAAAAGRS